MNIEKGKTPTNQEYISFKTRYNDTCTLVIGNRFLRCAFRDQDDTSLHAPYTHFTRDEVKKLLPYLQAFVTGGTFELQGGKRT